MKSASANVGAKQIASVCAQLEAIGRANTTIGASELLALAEAEFERASSAYAHVLQAAAPVAAVKDDLSSAMTTPAAFDPAAFQKTLPAGMGVDSLLARKLMRLFVGESAKLIAEIERAAAVADSQALFRAAHSLKSSGAAVGASAFAVLAKELESLARAGQTEALADRPARLRLAYERFCAEPAICEMLVPESVERNAA